MEGKKVQLVMDSDSGRVYRSEKKIRIVERQEFDEGV